MAPHVSRRRVGETWAAKGRKVPRGEGRTHVCYPHEWYQSVPHAHGVLRTARWACPHDLRAVRAAHPSARGPRKGRARTIVTCYYGSACFGGRSSLKSITPATSTINPIYTLGKLVSLPLKLYSSCWNDYPEARYSTSRLYSYTVQVPILGDLSTHPVHTGSLFEIFLMVALIKR